MRLPKIEPEFPVFNAPTDGGGGSATSVPQTVTSAPAAESAPTPPPSTSVGDGAQGATNDAPSTSDETAFVLDAFDAMQVDDLDSPDETPGLIPSDRPAASQVPASQGAPQAPAQTPVAPAQPGDATPPVQAAAQPTAPQPGVPQPSGQPPEAPPEELLDRIHQEVAKHHEIFTQKLAETVYKIPDKELESFNENPAEVIAKVAARVHTNVVASLTKVLSQQMPVYVHGLLQANERAARNENDFWAGNPFLDKRQHSQIATQVATAYKRMNPNATRDEFIRAVGAMTMGALGLTAQAVGQRTNGAGGPPPVQTPGPVVRQVPPAYAPAQATAPASSHPQPQRNQWDEMTMILERGDQGAFDT